MAADHSSDKKDIVKAHSGELFVETLSVEAAAQAGKKPRAMNVMFKCPSRF
jgi:hypothetical protein